jgi:pimeloyl-ACP methyl ester carboxylesterase
MHRRHLIAGAAGVAAAALLAPPNDAGAAPTAVPDSPADFAAQRRFAATSFGRIAYVERGKGPLALFLHAWPLNGYQWRGALARLADTRRCVAPDVMGLGYTEVADGQEITPAAQADMLAAFMDALGARRADFVANDSGGLVAQMFAARHPERVRSLLLTNCDVQRDNPPPSFVPLVQAAQAGILADHLLARLAGNLALARSPQGLGVGYADPQTLTADSVQCYLRPLVGEAARREQLQRYTIALGHNDLVEAEAALRRLPAPVRIVWGADDTVFSPTSPEVLDGIFPQSLGVRRVPGAKLFFPEERPDVIAEEARLLWRRAGAA